MKETEVWKDIPEYEGLYQVSNWGRVKSLPRNTTKGKILKPNLRGEYYSTFLYKNGEVKNFYIHRLVCLAFLENPKNLPIINHKDENKENNHVDNLEWCDNFYNIHYGSCQERKSKSMKGKNKAQKGKPNYKRRKPIQQFTKQDIFIREWNGAFDVEKELNIYATSITACCKGKLKSAGGFIWRYKE